MSRRLPVIKLTASFQNELREFEDFSTVDFHPERQGSAMNHKEHFTRVKDRIIQFVRFCVHEQKGRLGKPLFLPCNNWLNCLCNHLLQIIVIGVIYHGSHHIQIIDDTLLQVLNNHCVCTWT